MLAVLALAVGLTAGFHSPTARADHLEKELLERAPQVIRYLQGRGYRQVGVLKFRVQKGQAAPTDNAGLLNLAIADRLEMALILKNDFRSPVQIVHNASAVAARLPGANHLTREGRQKLFAGRYPLAWGNEEVTPDAFLTGVVRVDADLRQMTVYLGAFD